MQTTSKLIAAILFGFFCQITLAAPSDTYDKIQKAIDDFRAQYHIPSAQVSISMPDENTTQDFVSGTILKNGSTKINPNNLFGFGSNTKSFTAAMILQLDTAGKLSINDTLDKYFPQYPQWKNITIKQLLHHTSGIFNYTEDKTFIQNSMNLSRIWNPEELVAIAAAQPLYFTPGTSWHYSNTNYVIAGMIIEKITANTYTNEITQRLTDLQLNNTHFAATYSDDVMSNIAHTYIEKKMAQHISVWPDITTANFSAPWSAGAIVSNTQDFVRWPRLLFQQGKVIDADHLSKMEELVCMDTSAQPKCKLGQPVSPEIGGYGTGIFEMPLEPFGNLWGHDGGVFGYLTMFIWLPKYNSTIAIALSSNGDIEALLTQILEILYQSPEWQQYRVEHNIPYVAINDLKGIKAALDKFSINPKEAL